MSDHDTQSNQPSSHTVGDLRAVLFNAITAVREGKMSIEQARSVNDIAKTLIDSARVEVDFLRITDGTKSPFLEPPRRLPAIANGAGQGNGIDTVVHQIGRATR